MGDSTNVKLVTPRTKDSDVSESSSAGNVHGGVFVWLLKQIK